MNVTATASWMLIVGLSIALLILGKDILVPIAIAVCIWYIINYLAGFLGRVKVGGRSIPGGLSVFVSTILINVVIFLGIEIVIRSVNAMVEQAPTYQENWQRLLKDVMAWLDVRELPSVAQIAHDVDLGPVINTVGTELSAIASNVFLVIIYTIFLLLEQHTFRGKWRAMFRDKESYQHAHHTLGRIHDGVREYISVKTAVSLLTGLLSFAVMALVGLDFAIFWAFLIFLFNFVPTFGSMIATIFPSAFALLQFDSLTPVLGTFIGIMAIQLLVGNFIEPKLMGKTLNISSLVVLISLAVWGALWGVIGMVLAVPIMVILMIILSEFETTRAIAIWLSADGNIYDAESHETENAK